MTRWQAFKSEVAGIGKWLVTSLVWMRDQFTFLRGEHIRSVAFLYICWQGERSWRALPEDASLLDLDAMVLITLLCLGAAIGLAWQATSAKIKIAGFQAELGREVTAADDLFAGDSQQMRQSLRAWSDESDEGEPK